MDENNYFPEVEITKGTFKINGQEIKGVTNYKIDCDSDSPVVQVNVSFTAKCIK